MLDNIAGMVLTVSLLSIAFGFPAEFALRYMIPGTAIGVLAGDLLYFLLAFVLARRTGRQDVTAMPLGLDTPSTIGMVLFVLGPAFVAARGAGMDQLQAATQAWHIGICAIFITGLIKLACSLGAGWIRRMVPRAGLLGSLAAIALVLIAFMPLLDVAKIPIVGFSSLAIILVTLVARGRLPWKIPGAAGALVVGCAVYYGLYLIDLSTGTQLVPPLETSIAPQFFPLNWTSVLTMNWLAAMDDTIAYLPYIIPFAIMTVIGGIDCTESAASAGDEYDTGQIIGIEAVATIVASLCGGVIQTTPYIGHPAYKAMGGRALYTLLTALFVGGAGLVGYFAYLYMIIPRPAVYPILVFIGLEIAAQSYHVTPRRHYAALALACLPAVAKVITVFLGDLIQTAAVTAAQIGERVYEQLSILQMLSAGFIVSSLLWASAMAKIIDRRLFSASLFFAICGICTLFGVIHSPLREMSGGQIEFAEWMYLPWQLAGAQRSAVLSWAAAYLVVAALLFGLGWMQRKVLTPIDTDEEFERL